MAAEQGDAAAGNDALGDRRPGGVQGVLDAALLLLHVGLGGRADADDGHAAGQLGQPFAELLLVVLALGLLHLGADLLDPLLDVGFLAGAVDDRRVFLLDAHRLGLAELVERDVLQLEAQVLADELAAGQDGDVAEHGLAAVAEARGLDGADLQNAAQLVDDQGRQRLALHILGDDQQRLAGLRDLLQQRQHVADVGELLLVDQDVAVLQLAVISVGSVTK